MRSYVSSFRYLFDLSNRAIFLPFFSESKRKIYAGSYVRNSGKNRRTRVNSRDEKNERKKGAVRSLYRFINYTFQVASRVRLANIINSEKLSSEISANFSIPKVLRAANLA